MPAPRTLEMRVPCELSVADFWALRNEDSFERFLAADEGQVHLMTHQLMTTAPRVDRFSNRFAVRMLSTGAQLASAS